MRQLLIGPREGGGGGTVLAAGGPSVVDAELKFGNGWSSFDGGDGGGHLVHRDAVNQSWRLFCNGHGKFLSGSDSFGTGCLWWFQDREKKGLQQDGRYAIVDGQSRH